MRPKRAAKRRSTSELPEDDAETDEESLPTSARDSDASSESHNNESSDEEVETIERIPDPRATRHSGRSAAQKTVDYSSKHHPQDHSLPGHQHKARARKRMLKDAKRSMSLTPKPAKIPGSTIDLTKEATDEESEAEEQEEEEPEEGPAVTKTARKLTEQKSESPRKQLRTLTASRKRGKGKKTSVKKAGTGSSSDVVNLLGTMKALTSSEAAEWRRLNQKIRTHASAEGLGEETEEDPADGLPMFADLNSSQNPKTRQYDDDDDANMFTFMDHGHSSNEATGEVDVMITVQTSTKINDTEIRRDSHQSQDHPPPSQFDEQLAVTEIRSKQPDEDTSEDPISGLEAALRGEPRVDGERSRASAKSDGHDISPTTTRSDSIPEVDIESSNMNKDSSVADDDLYKTPDTNHGGSNQSSKQRSKSNNERTTSDRHPTRMARTNTDPRPARPSLGSEDMPSLDLDETLLRHYRSSQRSRSTVLMESDPTSGNNSEECSDHRIDSE